MKNLLCIFLIILIAGEVSGQRNVKDSIIGTPLIGVHYGANIPAGDLADRFGFLNHVGIMAGYKTNKNWFWGFDANFIFGNKIKAFGLFDGIVDSYGNITDQNGDIANVIVNARGFNANIAVGKIFPVLSPNENSGILVHVGVGYLLHHLSIESQDQVIPVIELDYKKGYDRLTIGPNIHQFIGYSFMANRGYYNFYGGFYFQQGFTKNQRTVFFDQPDEPVPTNVRFDIQYGIRAGWFIPFYKRKPKDFYFD